ncbi:MAG: cupin domain-containing protein [Clostridiales bacterium]|nr:cupin domain-containing protein [Clostridiales bacterium]
MEQEERQWGYFTVLYSDTCCKIKHLYIAPYKNISYQYHRHRDEYWTIVQGSGKFILDGETRQLQAGDRVEIAAGQWHTIQNIGEKVLVIHEIQTGKILEESDIVRREVFPKI